jgi:hypothetical protein
MAFFPFHCIYDFEILQTTDKFRGRRRIGTSESQPLQFVNREGYASEELMLWAGDKMLDIDERRCDELRQV